MENNKIELSGIFSEGYGVIPKALMKRKDLTISEKAIIAYFLSYTGGGNTCFPSYAQICEDLQISKTTLSKCIHNIENKGYIKISALFPDDKLRHNYKYTLIFIEGLKSEPTEVKKINPLVKKNEPTCIKNLNSNNNNINNNNINNNITPDKSGGKKVIELYIKLLKENNIIYIPKKYEYINFYNEYKKYINKGITNEDILRAMDLWFADNHGAWCGYKLGNFWGDISKIQMGKKLTKKEQIIKNIGDRYGW